MFIDSHAHIDGPEYDADRDEVITRAAAAGVTIILNVGTGDPHSGAFERAANLAATHKNIYAAIGVHPHDAKLYDDAAEAKIHSLIAATRKILAWGEIGLDYHYDNSPRDTQRQVFRRQLQAARACELPVVIHTRSADEDTIEILRSEQRQGSQSSQSSQSSRGGIMHCFGGSLELALAAIDLGFYISFSGNITFKKADELRAIASQLPLERLLIETDCPYLTPVPFRGKRNEPARVVEVARCLSSLQGISLEEVGRITTANFAGIFRLQEV
ncbi:MAG: TatD family hydrolase [Acidobacteriota bacterium]|nr:TatD family hydrolase [Acidobacteriota bacterium]